jgi:hypothetical protein
MLIECAVCGAKSLTSRSETCPKCGSAASDAEAARAGSDVLRFPLRRTTSLDDQVEMTRAKMLHNLSLEGTAKVFFAWSETLERRPLDIPLYAAQEGHPVIAILFSSGSLPEPQTLDALARTSYPFVMQVRAFLEAGYPLLRMNLLVPDNPADPLWLESALDVCQGDVQDFLQAVLRNPTIHLMMAHESDVGRVVTVMLDASALPPVVKTQVPPVAAAVPPGGTVAQFQAAVRQMEQVFPRPYSGVETNRLIRLPRK